MQAPGEPSTESDDSAVRTGWMTVLRNLGTHRRLWSLTASIALVVSLAGLARPAIYDPVVTDRILPGVVSQDGVTVLVSLVVLGLAVGIERGAPKRQLLLVGAMGYLFYAYGIYVIEQLYTPLYFGYMAVFGLAAYSIVYSLTHLMPTRVAGAVLPRRTRLASLALLVLTPLVFYPLWMSQLLPQLRSGTRLEYFYSVYILDLCFVMPAFLITAYTTYRRDGFGPVMTPVVFTVGFAVLLPLPPGELLRPTLTGDPSDVASLGLFLTLSAVYLLVAAVSLRGLRFSEDSLEAPEAQPREIPSD